jgi:predicted nucleic acid-binding protein
VTVIVDSSALVAYLLEESGFEGVRDVLAAGASGPGFLAAETANAILEASRSGRIDAETAATAIGAMGGLLERSNIELYPEKDLIEAAFRMAAEHGLTVYDSLFLALAAKLGGSLASRDRKQWEAAVKLGIEVLET